MTQDPQLEGKIRATIESLLASSGKPREFSREQSLFVSGLLDSLAAIRLIAELEAKFGLRMDNAFTIQRLDSLGAILAALENPRRA